MNRFLLTAAVACLFTVSAAVAQTTTAALTNGTVATAPVAAMTTPIQSRLRKERAAECSRQATEKGLHGELRKAFRAKCKKGIAN